MAKYRRKPTVTDAVRWDGKMTTLRELGCFESEVSQGFLSEQLQVQTQHGEVTAEVGDYVVKDVDGWLYPCDAGIFEATYEPADDGGY